MPEQTDMHLKTFGGILLSLVLVFNLGCAQTQSFIKADSARVAQEEKQDFSIYPQGAGQETDWNMYESMEGGE